VEQVLLIVLNFVEELFVCSVTSRRGSARVGYLGDSDRREDGV